MSYIWIWRLEAQAWKCVFVFLGPKPQINGTYSRALSNGYDAIETHPCMQCSLCNSNAWPLLEPSSVWRRLRSEQCRRNVHSQVSIFVFLLENNWATVARSLFQEFEEQDHCYYNEFLNPDYRIAANQAPSTRQTSIELANYLRFPDLKKLPTRSLVLFLSVSKRAALQSQSSPVSMYCTNLLFN